MAANLRALRPAAEIEISLTDFVEYTIRSGPAKVTVVREIKNRDRYEPAVDFWKPLRDAMVDLQRDGKLTKAALDAVIDAQGHELKRRLYPEAASGYLRFLGKRKVEWMTPPRGTWVEGRLGIRVNPELALRIGGKPTVIKLYFKREDLTRPRVQASIGVMLAELGSSTAGDTQFGVLDVRSGKLLLADGRWNKADTQILIRAEARSFAEMWEDV